MGNRVWQVAWVASTALFACLGCGSAVGALTKGSGAAGVAAQPGPKSALSFNPQALARGREGTRYSADLEARGGTPGYAWSIASGSLPPGLSVVIATGQISGVPTASGIFHFTAQVEDSGSPVQRHTASMAITVSPSALTIQTPDLPKGKVGTAYTADVSAKGGTPAYAWSLESGRLPPGLSLAAATGQISGTPTASGRFTATVKATDSGSPVQSHKAAIAIEISPSALVIETPALPSGQVGTPYTGQIESTGGTPGYTWSIKSGSLPSGLKLTPATGQISGTPTISGTFSFVMRVADSGSPAQSETASASILVLPVLASGTTYYFANSGRDSNPGTSASSPFATVAKANAMLAMLKPGDSVLFKAGDVFRDDYLRCGSAFTNTGTSTIANAPPPCSGASGSPITIGAYGTGAAPVLDAADPLELSWTSLPGSTGVYYAQLPAGAAVPQKLFIDCALQECLQLLPMANATGAWSATTTYNYLDAVTYQGSVYVYGATTGRANAVPTGPYWVNTSNGNQGNATQAFPVTNTGLQNVERGAKGVASIAGYGYPSYPGVFWYDGHGTIYVNLADGSSPNAHSLEATHRPYGVVLEGVNYVTVQGLTFEHAGMSCALSYPYASDKGTYFVGEHNTFSGISAWNCTGISPDYVPQQENVSNLRGGIVLHGDGQYNPHLVAGNSIVNAYVGMLDNYFATPGDASVAGVFAAGQDGGGTANNCVLCSSKVIAITSPGLIYSAYGTLDFSGMTVRNNGGRIAGNEFTNNQGSIFFGDTVGGSVDTNYVHESYAEGIQLGGNSTSTSGAPQTVTGNVIVNLGKGASLVGYNGIDCNSLAQVAGIQLTHNTIWNTWGAGATFEGIDTGGCVAPTVESNIIGQDAAPFPSGTGLNASYIFYTDASVRAMGTPVSDHNLYTMGGGNNFADGYPSFAQWVDAWPDTDSMQANPMFVDSAAGNWRLQEGSPARGLATDGADAGALPYNTIVSSGMLNPALK